MYAKTLLRATRPYTHVDRLVGKKGRGPLIPDERRDWLLISLLSSEWTPDPVLQNSRVSTRRISFPTPDCFSQYRLMCT